MTEQLSQGARFYIEDGAAPTSHTISSVSKASPAVVAVGSATGLAVGDIVVPKNTGFKTIDDMPFRVSVVSTLNITLEDSDTSDEVGTANTSTSSLDEYAFVEWCVVEFSTTSPAGTVIDVTTMCDVARRTRSGLPGQQSWTGNGFWDTADPAFPIVRAAYRGGDLQVFKLQWKDNSGITFRGTVDSLDMASGVDKAVTRNVGGKISGFINGVSA